MQMKFESNVLMLDSGISLTFNYPIWEVLDMRDAIAVLLATSGTKHPLPDVKADINATKNRNVFAISKADGRVIWQVASISVVPTERESPYVGIRRRDDGNLGCVNWDDITLVVDPTTGKEVDRVWAGKGLDPATGKPRNPNDKIVYTREQLSAAIWMMRERGWTVEETARQLQVPEKTLRKRMEGDG